MHDMLAGQGMLGRIRPKIVCVSVCVWGGGGAGHCMQLVVFLTAAGQVLLLIAAPKQAIQSHGKMEGDGGWGKVGVFQDSKSLT